MRFEVYLHTSPSGKSYVGWTSRGWRSRWQKHVSDAMLGADMCPAFHAAIRKYGPENFEHRVLERLVTEEGAKRAERLWIRELRTRIDGYNISEGGDGFTGKGRVFSAEHRARLAESHRGKHATPETRAKMSIASLARSSEAKAKCAASRRGVRLSEETRAKMSIARRAWWDRKRAA